MSVITISQYADLITSAAVVLSVLFLAWEIRINTKETRRSNWTAAQHRISEHKRRTDDPQVADIILRGKQDFKSLSDTERLIFGYWLEEYLLNLEGIFADIDQSKVAGFSDRRAAEAAVDRALAFEGAREWWEWSALENCWPDRITGEVKRALSEKEKQ